MKEDDFKAIPFFPEKEICATGARLEDVQLETIQALQVWRVMINRTVHLQFNGLTSGEHKAIQHSRGLAVDCFLSQKEGGTNDFRVMSIHAMQALEAGFKGIGIYWNGLMYSYHFDLGPYRFWSASKKQGENAWNYKTLLCDPRI